MNILGVLNLRELHILDRRILYSIMYGATKEYMTRINEEGCGAVFAAAVFNPNE